MAEQAAHFRKNLQKFTESQGELAKSYHDGASATLVQVLTTGDDAWWVELVLREDGNGNPSWYVDLFSCSQEIWLTLVE